MRLSIHLNGSKNMYAPQCDLWLSEIRKIAGGTLGIDQDDFGSPNFITMNNVVNLGTDCYNLTTIGEKEEYARELNDKMHLDVLEEVDSKICKRLNEMDSTDLRNQLDICWSVWKQEFETEKSICGNYFSSILHPKSEGDSVSGELRVGCKTAKLIADAIFLTMVVSVAFNDDDKYHWISLSSGLKMRTIGLRYWSGSAASSKRVIEIDDEDEISQLLGQESEEVVILSGSNVSIDNLLHVNMADNSLYNGLLSDCKRPQLVVPYNKSIKRLINQGDLSKIKDYFQKQIDEYKRTTQESIEKITNY